MPPLPPLLHGNQLENRPSKSSDSFSAIFLNACAAFKTILPKRDTIAVLITSHKRESNRCINIFYVFIKYLLNCYTPVGSLMKSPWINHWFPTPSSTKTQGRFAFSPYVHSLSFLLYVTLYKPLYFFSSWWGLIELLTVLKTKGEIKQ